MNDLESARLLVDGTQRIVDAAVARAAEVTEGGAKIDDYQVHTERVTYLATQVRAGHELTAAAERLAAAGKADTLMAAEAFVYAAEAAHATLAAVDAAWEEFGIGAALDAIGSAHLDTLRNAMRAGLAESRVREIDRKSVV